MRVPPYLVSMRIVQQERTKFRLWFPLFLLWPLLLPLLLLTFIGTLFADAVGLATGRKTGYTRFVFAVLGIMGETRGTEVFVQEQGNTSRTVAFTLR
jgi:polyferredoxin